MKALRPVPVALGLVSACLAMFVARGGPAAQAVSPPPTFGQPTISGVDGVGFEEDIRVDKTGVVYTSVPGSLSSDSSWVWKSLDGGKTFKWVTGAAPLEGKYNLPTCAGGGDTEIATDSHSPTPNLYFADLTLANFSTSRSPDQGTTNTNCTNTAVPDTAVDRQWFAVDGDPTANDGTQIGNTIYLVNDEIGPGNVQCPVSGFVNNTLVMYRSPHPSGFGAGTGGAGEAGITFGNPNRVTGIGSCNEGIMGNDEVSPVATTTGKKDPITGMPAILGTPVKHIYVDHDDASLSRILIGRCFPVAYGVSLANVSDPSGLNCDDLPVATLGTIPAGKSFPTAKTGANFPTMAIDKSGNLYVVWEQAPTDPDTGKVTGDTVLKYAFSTDEGTTWSAPINIPLSSPQGTLHNNVFAWAAAGDDGRVDIAWIGTPGIAPVGQNGPDSCPDGSSTPPAGASVCDWSMYMAQTLNGHGSPPTFTAPILASEHFVHRGSMFTLIGGQNGDRTLGDFFQMRIGLQGEAYLSFADSNNRDEAFAPHGMVARQNGGPGVFAAIPTVSVTGLTPQDSVTDPSGDGKFEAGGLSSASEPALDILASSVSRPDATHYRITMTLNSLPKKPPNIGPSPDTDTDLVWLTQWLQPDTCLPSPCNPDFHGGKNFFVYAETTAGGAVKCFDGDNAASLVGGGVTLTYPGRKAIAASGCTYTSGTPGTITIDVPISDLTFPAGNFPIDNLLHQVTASTMTLQQPANSCPFSGGIGGCLFNLIDVAQSYDATPESADLALTKTDSPDPVHTHENLTYTITVHNNGPSTATGVLVTDQLPMNTAFGTATASQGSCSLTQPAKRIVTCNLGTIASGATATVTIVVGPPSKKTVITNTASVSAATSDPNTANNSASASTTVIP